MPLPDGPWNPSIPQWHSLVLKAHDAELAPICVFARVRVGLYHCQGVAACLSRSLGLACERGCAHVELPALLGRLRCAVPPGLCAGTARPVGRTGGHAPRARPEDPPGPNPTRSRGAGPGALPHRLQPVPTERGTERRAVSLGTAAAPSTPLPDRPGGPSSAPDRDWASTAGHHDPPPPPGVPPSARASQRGAFPRSRTILRAKPL